MLNQLWNMALISIVTYGLFTLDPFEFNRVDDSCHFYKPLFAFLSEVCYLYVYTGMFFFTHLYFQLYAIRTLQLMDNECFQRFYTSKRQAVLYFLVTAVVNHGFFLSIYFDSSHNLLDFFASSSRPFSYSNLLSLICVYNGSFFHIYLCSVFYYHIYAFNGILREFEAGLKSQRLEECYVVERIIGYAALIDQLNVVYSLPAILYLIFNVFNLGNESQM